jgi:hypothetical protein
MAIGGKVFFMDTEYFPPCLSIDVVIGSPDPKVKEDYKIKSVLIDTGSDLTIIPNKIIKKLKLKMTGPVIRWLSKKIKSKMKLGHLTNEPVTIGYTR